VVLSIIEQLAYSTVRIECETKDGKIVTGTGFFFNFKEMENGNSIPVVITNKHVIKDSKKGTLIFTRSENSEPNDISHFRILVDNFECAWRLHPDENVDLCAMAIATLINEAEKQKVNLFYRTLNFSFLPKEEHLSELSPLEDIVMVGYPCGLWDTINNQPIFRKGVMATHPCKDYDGKPSFVVDIGCFPGSSGSPVFIYNNGGYTNKKGDLIWGKSRLILMGILYGGFMHSTEGNIVESEIPTTMSMRWVSRIPNNLGLVVKSSKIRDLEDLF
jgi:V8-like Glu-specific endopeptidase